VRPLSAREAKHFSMPRSRWNAALGMTEFSAAPVPDPFWQLVQWQARNSAIGALTVYRIAPHMQLPEILSLTSPPRVQELKGSPIPVRMYITGRPIVCIVRS